MIIFQHTPAHHFDGNFEPAIVCIAGVYFDDFPRIRAGMDPVMVAKVADSMHSIGSDRKIARLES